MAKGNLGRWVRRSSVPHFDILRWIWRRVPHMRTADWCVEIVAPVMWSVEAVAPVTWSVEVVEVTCEL